MAVVDMAYYSGGKPVSLHQIAIRQNIALNYLEQIFCNLRKKGIVRSVKGPGGGYVLNGEMQDIHISDIMMAMNQSFNMTRCSTDSKCGSNGVKCMTHHVWSGLSKNIIRYLGAISLHDVVSGSKKNMDLMV